MYSDFRALDPSKYLDKVSPGRTATVVVAAVDASLQARAQADLNCDGVSDQDTINEAFNHLGANGGRVVLSEGTFVIDGPIVIPVDNITLRGQGRSTLIDGDGLATNEHAIVISGVTNCTIKKLAIQTEAGGGKTCHCIFIEDGANSFEIEYVTIVDSDSDGIHIEGTNIFDGSIHNCHIEDADDYGIYVSMAAANSMLRLHIFDNFVTGAGNSGIALWGAAGNSSYCNIVGNIVYLNGDEGITIWDSDYTIINNNISFSNGQWGIRVRVSEHVNLNNNICQANGIDGIMLETSNGCVIEGNICVDNTWVNGDGIQIQGINNTVVGNHCHGNGRHGIHILVGAPRCLVSGNTSLENGQHGINVAGPECEISENYIYDNSQALAEEYHGINLAGTADRVLVNSNFIASPGDMQEDGIHLESGAIDCQINDNYIYNMMGSGICLAAANLDCEISGNYVRNCDDCGIEIGAGADRSLINNNKCYGNGSHGIYLIVSDYCSIVGNICNGNTGATTDGMLVSSCDYCTISGNVCTANGKDGIVLAATSIKCIVIGNQLLGNDGDALVDGGTDTEIGHSILV